MARGSLASVRLFQAFSAPTLSPSLAETQMMPVSATRRACATSPAKSKYPGVSMMFIFVF